MAAARLAATSLMRGVCGRDGCLSPSWSSSSARMSCSAPDGAAVFGLAAFLGAAAVLSSMPSNSSSRSSVATAALDFLLAMAGRASVCLSVCLSTVRSPVRR